jgi:Contractile injection system tube protein
MSEFPGRPTVQKGALIVYESQAPGAQPSSQIVFQYNPETLRRSFATRSPQRDASKSSAAREDVLSVPGPPVETITLSVELDAVDQLEDAQHSEEVDSSGLFGALAALELLLYPTTAQVSQIEQQAEAGAVQVHPGDTPLVVLAWGASRVVPVQITSLNVSEELFDPALNPVRAKVDLGLKVLTYMEFTRASVGRDTFIAHQKHLEEVAREWVGA